jgi:hypothetical protein
MTKNALMLALMLASAGCLEEPVGDSFSEVRCGEGPNGGELCLGRPSGSADAWVIVISDEQIDRLVDAGLAVGIGAWADGCANGQAPSNFMPDTRCIWHTVHGTSICYSGDGQWWTHVERCVPMPTGPAWQEFQCDGNAGTIGEMPWDSVKCYETEAGSCIGQSSDDLMWVLPTCWVDENLS